MDIVTVTKIHVAVTKIHAINTAVKSTHTIESNSTHSYNEFNF